VSAVDPLQWLKMQTDTYKCLSRLARAVIAMSVTGALSEQIFSTAGIVLNAKCSTLFPRVVDKIVFVQEKSHMLEECNAN